ncbi:MAG: copper chaperone PCu(A)C [Pseudomonadota bacterium]
MRSLIALLLLAAPLAAHEYRVSGITIDHPFAFETTADTAEGYLILVSDGPADTLLGVSGDFARVSIEGADTVPIPAGGFAELLPGGTHILFEGIEAPWVDGDRIAATLIFEKAGEVPVVFNVETPLDGDPATN